MLKLAVLVALLCGVTVSFYEYEYESNDIPAPDPHNIPKSVVSQYKNKLFLAESFIQYLEDKLHETRIQCNAREDKLAQELAQVMGLPAPEPRPKEAIFDRVECEKWFYHSIKLIEEMIGVYESKAERHLAAKKYSKEICKRPIVAITLQEDQDKWMTHFKSLQEDREDDADSYYSEEDHPSVIRELKAELSREKKKADTLLKSLRECQADYNAEAEDFRNSMES